jgi:putative hydrolase of the HAD superfamily
MSNTFDMDAVGCTTLFETAKAFIFDLDDTLCDYKGAKARAKASVSLLLEAAGLEPSSIWVRYESLEPQLFKAMTRGEISVAEYRLRRYQDCLIASGIRRSHSETLAAEANERYMSIANEQVTLFPDVLATLATLRTHGFRLAILTNGPSGGQRAKLQCLGLERMVDAVQISEEVGVAKPAPEAYRLITSQLGVPAERAVMVGDSMEFDIEGALAAGLNGILIDRTGELPDPPGILRLSDLVGIPGLVRGTGGSK